jgi:hypothetical protein
MRNTLRCLLVALALASAQPASAIVQEGQPAPALTKNQLDYPSFGMHTPRSLAEFSGKVIVMFVTGHD